jgi:hypothetical protein
MVVLAGENVPFSDSKRLNPQISVKCTAEAVKTVFEKLFQRYGMPHSNPEATTELLLRQIAIH